MDLRNVLCFLAFCQFDSLFVDLILLKWHFPVFDEKVPKEIKTARQGNKALLPSENSDCFADEKSYQ